MRKPRHEADDDRERQHFTSLVVRGSAVEAVPEWTAVCRQSNQRGATGAAETQREQGSKTLGRQGEKERQGDRGGRDTGTRERQRKGKGQRWYRRRRRALQKG